VATVLLSGGGTTLAGWNDAEQRDLAAVSAGELSVEPLAAATVVLRPGTSQPLPVGTALVPGDVVRVTSTVRVTASGELLTAHLALDTSALRGLGRSTVTVTTTLPGAGAHRWTVIPEHDGARVTAVVELTVPAGLPQHTTIDVGALRWALTQEMP